MTDSIIMELNKVIFKLENENVEDVNYSSSLHGCTCTVLNAEINYRVVHVIEIRKEMLLPIKQLGNRTFFFYDYMVYNSISRNDNVKGWKCDCRGFLFKHSCKHIQSIAKKFDI